ncbi:MAG: hypothetical protein HYS23_11570 [Geobacter sp.]|nr:hypothetical protein [Geobacter sp.]
MRRRLGILVGVFLFLSFTSSLWAGDQTTEPPFFVVKMPDDGIACSASLQKELEFIYLKYNHAAEAGNFEEFQKYMIEYQATASKNVLVTLSKGELKKRKKVLQEMASKKFSVQACLVSESTGYAALAGTGMSIWKGKFVNSRGSILFKKEGNSWKVQTTGWNPIL